MGVPFQQCIGFKQTGANFQDRESAPTQSTDQSFSQLLTIGSDIQTPQKDDNAKLVNGQVDSVVSGISQDSIFSAQMDYKQSLVCVPFSNAEPCLGGIMATYRQHTMIPHTVIANSRVPLPFDPFRDEPMYVNPKQYHGILRRRQQRAKLEALNKLAKDRKPYLHESRHLHAVRRARGSGGRFVSAKKLQESKPDNSEKYRGGSCTTSSSEASNGGEIMFPNPNFVFSNYSSYVVGNQKWSL